MNGGQISSLGSGSVWQREEMESVASLRGDADGFGGPADDEHDVWIDRRTLGTRVAQRRVMPLTPVGNPVGPAQVYLSSFGRRLWAKLSRYQRVVAGAASVGKRGDHGPGDAAGDGKACGHSGE